MYEKFGQFINGKWQSSSNETYEVINPATEELLGKASKANSADIHLALKSAEKGFEVWKNTSPWERSKIIRNISEIIKKKFRYLSKWLTLEVGKPISESLGEVMRLQIYLSGIQKKQKEYLERQIKVDFQTQEFTFIINRLVW